MIYELLIDVHNCLSITVDDQIIDKILVIMILENTNDKSGSNVDKAFFRLLTHLSSYPSLAWSNLVHN